MSLDLVDQSCSGESHECSIGEASGSYLNGVFCCVDGVCAQKSCCQWGVPLPQSVVLGSCQRNSHKLPADCCILTRWSLYLSDFNVVVNWCTSSESGDFLCG